MGTSEKTSPASAIERARAYGLDITLLIENLRYSPADRVRRGEQILKSAIAFKREIERARRQKTGQA